MNNKAQSGLVSAFIGIMIACIIGIGIVIPIVADVIANATGISGMTLTVLGYIPLLLAVVLIVAVAVLIR